MAKSNRTYQGKPCPHGHSGLRYISGNACVECRKSFSRTRKTQKVWKPKEFHGLSYHPLYRIWAMMIGRCERPGDTSYRNYGAKGVTVCDRWRSSFQNFINDMGERPSPKHSIERIDTLGNYEPGNCKWATRTEQNRNHFDTKLTISDARTVRNLYARGSWNMPQLAVQFGVTTNTISNIVHNKIWKE